MEDHALQGWASATARVNQYFFLDARLWWHPNSCTHMVATSSHAWPKPSIFCWTGNLVLVLALLLLCLVSVRLQGKPDQPTVLVAFTFWVVFSLQRRQWKWGGNVSPFQKQIAVRWVGLCLLRTRTFVFLSGFIKTKAEVGWQLPAGSHPHGK